MSDIKIIICVLSLEKEPYISLEKTIRETWGNNTTSSVEIIYYYGNGDENKLVGDKFYSKTPEGLYNIGYKTLNLFEYLINNYDFDYIFRTNLSSYVNINSLVDFIKDKPNDNFYSGVVGNSGDIKFASGSGYFISRDLIKKVINNKSNWDHNLIDDVSLGKLMMKLNIPIYPGKRMDIKNTLHLSENHYHYRVKNPINREVDIIRMNKIHKIIYKND